MFIKMHLKFQLIFRLLVSDHNTKLTFTFAVIKFIFFLISVSP